MRVLLIPPILVLLLVSACSSRGAGEATRSSDMITREEMTHLTVPSALEVVERLRPQWLRSRGRTSLRETSNLPVIFVDNSRYGDISSLRNIETSAIESIRFMRGRDATTRYGTGYPAGVIEVVTRR